MEIRNKNIILISQQDWGKMFISKHHYAVELSKLGNKVYYLQGPDRSGTLRPGEIIIEPTEFDNVFVIRHRLFYPYVIKFKLRYLHTLLIGVHVRSVIRKIGQTVDAVWSFDVSNSIPLKAFPKGILKIFMPVDEPKGMANIIAAETADVMFSVTNEILQKYHRYPVPKKFINHGVLEAFINEAKEDKVEGLIHIGLSGNFLRPDIDWETLLDIIDDNKDVLFDFYGPVSSSDRSNLNDMSSTAVDLPIERLRSFGNVSLHGTVDPQTLALQLKQMNGFLICYDIDKDQSKGTNYHKVLEYMATGKVIVSNNITTYDNEEALVVMPKERNNNNLPSLFKNVIERMSEYNSLEMQEKRIAYAKAHTYRSNIRKIERFISERTTY